MVRGVSYSPDEDAALARCWLAISHQVEEQNGTTFWDNVSEMYSKQPEALKRGRTAASLQSRWHALQNLVQKYLIAERVYYSNLVPSGASDCDIKKEIMLLYCHRSRKLDKNSVMKDAQPLKSMGADEILRRSPKFGGTAEINANSFIPTPTSTQGSTAGILESPSSSAVLSESPSKKRPIGIKKSLKKLEKSSGNAALSEIASALQDGSRRKEAVKREQLQVTRAQLRFNVVSALQEGE